MMLIETDVEPFWQDIRLAVECNYLFLASKQVTSKMTPVSIAIYKYCVVSA